MNLSELFAQSQGQPIALQGRSVQPIYRRVVQPDEEVRLTINHFCASPVQGIRLKLSSGNVQIGDGPSIRDVVLWTDVAPKVIVIRCLSSKAAELRIWNCWRDERGVMQAWIGNAAIALEDTPGGSCRLRCNSRNELTFNDLVLDVETVDPG